MPRLGASSKGDMLVRVLIDVPDTLSREEEELLKRLAELRGLESSSRRGVFSKFR
jgi:DnaJ-class molecular chaperone